MYNPLYKEYRRSSIIGLVSVILLSLTGAAIHYLRSVDDKVLLRKNQLQHVSARLDAEFTPIVIFAEAVRRTAGIKLALPPSTTDSSLSALQLASGHNISLAVTPEQRELQMLQRLWPYFELAGQAQAHLSAMYYISEQGFAINGEQQWPADVAVAFINWQQQLPAEKLHQREMSFYSEFLPEQAALTLPLYDNDILLGRLVFSLSLKTLLKPIQKADSDVHYMLLDGDGEVIHSSTNLSPQMINGHLLQVQRLDTMPWSLGLLEQKVSLFAAGLKDFLWHWLSYLLLLAGLLLLMQYRYRRRTLSGFNRLLVHTERLSKGQLQGVRHIPEGWRELFDRISQLSRSSASE